MKKFKRISFLLIACLAFTVFASCGSNGETGAVDGKKETITLRIGGGHVLNAMVYTSAASEFFCPEVSKRVAAETDYEIEWIEAYGGSVATVTEGLNACQTGLIDVLVNTYSFETARLFPMVACYYVPFASSDPVVVAESFRAVMTKYTDEYEELWNTYNQKQLALGPCGSYELITNFPVASIEDLKGKKIAAAGANLSWLEGTGAIPVQSNLNEAYTSIQTGVYDGWVMHADASYKYKLHEVAPYFTNVGFGACPIQGMSINLDVYNGLPEEVAEIIVEVAAEYETYNSQLQRDEDLAALDKMKAAGVTVNVLPDEDRTEWANGLANLAQQFADEAEGLGYPGADIINTYMEEQKARGFEPYRDWKAE